MSSNLGSFEVHNLAPCIDDRFPPNQNQILTAVASAHLARHDDANCNDSTVHQHAQVVVCRESAAEDICPLHIFRNEDQYNIQLPEEKDMFLILAHNASLDTKTLCR